MIYLNNFFYIEDALQPIEQVHNLQQIFSVLSFRKMYIRYKEEDKLLEVKVNRANCYITFSNLDSRGKLLKPKATGLRSLSLGSQYGKTRR